MVVEGDGSDVSGCSTYSPSSKEMGSAFRDDQKRQGPLFCWSVWGLHAEEEICSVVDAKASSPP